jgi:hypothetical protein
LGLQVHYGSLVHIFANYSFFDEAKKAACNGNTIQNLIATLSDNKSEVRSAAAGALMSISILVEAKKILVKENAASRLMDLLLDKNDRVVLNVIKVFSNY